MAKYIRDTHKLRTIHVRLRPSRSGMELCFASYLGAEELVTRDLPADIVGIQQELSVRAYQGAQFNIPSEVLQSLVNPLLATANDDEPFWLQVGSSAGHLGVVPWERFFQPEFGRPLLRVPNFLADPVFLSQRLRAAIVISSPRAKIAFGVADYAHLLANIAKDAVPKGTELHIFADEEAYDDLRALPSGPDHTIIVHDPRAAASYGLGGTDFAPVGLDGRLASPWLRWIRGALQGGALDFVHFVCPGFFRRDQGALALARSPRENEDRSWSHFIGADELIAFLDLVGAWSVGFSPPYENVWTIGLRLLADRLAWQRPGPLFVHDSEHGTPQDLIDTYRFLFASNDEQPPSTPSLSLYSHPKRMQCYRASEAGGYESVRIRGFGGEPGEMIPEQLIKLAAKASRSIQASETRAESAWVQANDLQLDRMLMKVGQSDSPNRRGALEALNQVQQIFLNAKSFDGMMTMPERTGTSFEILDAESTDEDPDPQQGGPAA